MWLAQAIAITLTLAAGTPDAGTATTAAVHRPSDTAQADDTRRGGEQRSTWSFHRTRHFTVAYGSSEREARIRGELLETTHEAFAREFDEATFGRRTGRDRLLCLLFDDRPAMLRYAQQADRIDASWTAAYYSARTNRVALVAQGPDEPRGGEDVAHSNDEHGIRTPLDGEFPVGPTEAADATLSHVSRASTTHEAAHQLAFNSGLQRRGVIYPVWVSEGLATNFEMLEHDGELGPSHDNPVRRTQLLDAGAADRLLPLVELVSLTRVPSDDARATRDLYAQSWGFFKFLYETRPDALADCLNRLGDLPPGVRDEQRVHEVFTRTVGDPERLERSWRRWLQSQAVASTAKIAAR